MEITYDKERDYNQEIKNLLSSDLFRRRDDLPWLDRAELAYLRFQEVNKVLKIDRHDVLHFTDKLKTIHEWVGCVDGTLMTIMSIHYNLCLGTILRLGKPSSLLEGVIQELESLESFGVYLGTELGFGNNLVSLKTEAVYHPEKKSFILTTPSVEAKKYMPNTGHPRIPKVAVVFARLITKGENQGVFPFVVRLRKASGELLPGVKVSLLGEKPGYHLDNAMTTFESVEVPYEFVLLGKDSHLSIDGEFTSMITSKRRRFLAAIDAVQAGKLSFCGAVMKGGFLASKIAANYTRHKMTFAPRQGDVPLIAYNNQKRDIYLGLAKALSIESFYQSSLSIFSKNSLEMNDEKIKICSLAKYYSSSLGQQIFLNFRERIGAQGLFCDNRIVEYLNYVLGIVSAEGDNQILQLKVAKDLVVDVSMAEAWVYLAPRSRRSVKSFDACLKLVSEREKILSRNIKRRMMLRGLKKQSLFDIWNSEVNCLLDLAEAHTFRLATRFFLKNAGESRQIKLSSEDAKKFQHLLLLDYIKRHQGWYLAKGMIHSKEVLLWHLIENKIMSEIDATFESSIESIDAPQNVLRSPLLATSLVAAYKHY